MVLDRIAVGAHQDISLLGEHLDNGGETYVAIMTNQGAPATSERILLENSNLKACFR